MKLKLRLTPLFAVLALTSLLLSGCSILFGKVKPVSEKSIHYQVMDLEKVDGDWTRVRPEQLNDIPDESSDSDRSYESQKTHALISLNSACRPSIDWDRKAPAEKRTEINQKNLRDFTTNLLLGIDVPKNERATDFSEEFIEIDGQMALQTTLLGKLNGQKTQIRSVVVRKSQCIFDLMLVGNPEHFKNEEAIFSRFVASLKLPK